MYVRVHSKLRMGIYQIALNKTLKPAKKPRQKNFRNVLFFCRFRVFCLLEYAALNDLYESPTGMQQGVAAKRS